MKLTTTTALACAAAATFVHSLHADPLVASVFTTETDLVVTGGDVHVAVTFGDGGAGQSAETSLDVNGITHGGFNDFGSNSANDTQTFGGVNVTTAGFNSVGDFRNQNGRYPVADEPALNQLFRGILPATNESTVSADGLSVGTTYLLQVYWEHTNNASVSYDFTVEGVQTTGLTRMALP